MQTSYPSRRPVPRHPSHDYTGQAAYLITFCTHRRRKLLGRLAFGAVLHTPIGRAVVESAEVLLTLRPALQIHALAVMPDHVHAVLICRELQADVPPSQRSPGAFVRDWKSAVTRQSRAAGAVDSRTSVWQRGFHDRILPDARAIECAERYVLSNPTAAMWDDPVP